MLVADLLDEREEHLVHFITKIVEFRRAEIGIVVDQSFDFFPANFGATFVEEVALVLSVETCLADHTWFSAAGAGADRETGFSVDTLSALELGFGHKNSQINKI